MRKAIYAAVMAVMIARPAFAFQCDAWKPMLKYMLTERRLGVLSTSIDKNANVFVVFVNTSTGEWAIVGLDPDATRACILLDGTDWQFIISQEV